MKIDWTKVKEGITTMDLLKAENKEQKEEIERLNNIINELEKEFDSVIKDPLIHMCYKRLARQYADKLQELKGSDKE